jgi:AraC-like DNA-binding protein
VPGSRKAGNVDDCHAESMYRERPSTIRGAVLWERTRTSADPLRVLPDGCLDLIWLAGRLVVAGPDTTAQLSVGPPGARYVGLRFGPGLGPVVLGVPAHELRDRQVDLADLWPAARVRRLTGRVAGAAGERRLDAAATSYAAGAGTVLEEIAADRLSRVDPPDPRIAGVVSRLQAGARIADTADAVGLGARGLHRLSRAAFGYGPKTLARILRLNRALDLARTGVPFATVAASAGYADQAHLSRDVRALAGVPLGVLLS